MKQINVYFDDEEYKELVKVKNGLTWHDFILRLIVIEKKAIQGGKKKNDRTDIIFSGNTKRTTARS